jgi:glycosyltransferase involved in cell wall biosynthesis
MKISIVIAAYNEEACLAQTIRSALAQECSDFEVIVVNNASTDRTEEIARGFPHVAVVCEPRQGLPRAREAGRLAASGDIIANLDADCLPGRDWLSKGSAYFNDARVVAASGPYDYYDGGLFFRCVSRCTQMSVYWLVSKIIQLPGIRAGAVMIGGNNLIRAEALKKAGGYNTALTFYGEDTDTAKRLSKHGKVVFSRRLVMKTSARRFKAEGVIKLELKYLRVFFKTIMAKELASAPEPGSAVPPMSLPMGHEADRPDKP